MKPKNRIYCPAIGRSKMLFETKEKADRFIKFNEEDIKKSGTIEFKHLRSYYCITCGGWHITHAELSEEEIKKKDSKINSIIQKAFEKEEKQKEDMCEFLGKFDLKIFGSRKKFKKYLQENQLIPNGLDINKLFHEINEIPSEYFTGSRDFMNEYENLSESDILKRAEDLYSELPLSKLTSKYMIKNYIKWEFEYKRNTPLLVIKKLNELCGL